MTYIEALDALIGHPHARHFRRLCADDNPDEEGRVAYRGLVVRLARGEPIGPPAPAPLPSPEQADRIIAELGRMAAGRPRAGGCCGGASLPESNEP